MEGRQRREAAGAEGIIVICQRRRSYIGMDGARWNDGNMIYRIPFMIPGSAVSTVCLQAADGQMGSWAKPSPSPSPSRADVPLPR